jgi:hypothetical protein
MTKGKREELQTHDSLIGRHLSQFLHKSGTEMVVVMTLILNEYRQSSNSSVLVFRFKVQR